MGFANFRENFILWRIERLAKGIRLDVFEEKEKLKRKQESFEQQKQDFIYLTQEGFSYEDNMFVKKEKIDYGVFPGTYKITIRLPEDYPYSQPIICFIPQGNFKISRHIISRWAQRDKDYQVCVMKNSNSEEMGDYWKPTMNVKGALLLSYQVVTGKLEDAHEGTKEEDEEDNRRRKIEMKKKELERKELQEKLKERKNRKKIPIKNTIFEELEKVSTVERFIKEFKNKNSILGKIDTTYQWTELAYICSQMSKTQKRELITFYNKEKEVKRKNGRTKSKRKK